MRPVLCTGDSLQARFRLAFLRAGTVFTCCEMIFTWDEQNRRRAGACTLCTRSLKRRGGRSFRIGMRLSRRPAEIGVRGVRAEIIFTPGEES